MKKVKVNSLKKSRFVGLLLVLILGGFGTFYGGALFGFAMCFVFSGLAFFWLIPSLMVVGQTGEGAVFWVAVLLLYVFMVLITDWKIRKFNTAVDLDEQRHNDLLNSVKGA